MGNRNSRQQQAATQQGAQPTEQQPQQQGFAPQYPPSQVYRPQPQHPAQPPGAPAHMNNGQFYGGWPAPPPPQQQPHTFGTQAPQGRAQAPQPPAPQQELTQTATIRNAVNLKKPTLEVKALPGNPTKLAINFTFDASAPCAASTYVLAAEDPAAGCKLTPAKQPPAPAVTFEKGLGLKFPPQAAAAAAADGSTTAAAAQHVIDLSLYEDDAEALTSASGKDGYPLVVRLETVTEKGLREGHTLAELVPGAEQQPWVQSQTTFAQLHREEDGSYSVRVLKQKIWVEGVSYELQEIYGLEQANAAARAAAASGTSTNEDDETRLCVICLVNDRDTTVLPCRHMCMCHECAQELRKQTSRCPICRNHVESLLHIKMGYKGPKPKADQPLTNAQLAAAEAANAANRPASAAAVAGPPVV